MNINRLNIKKSLKNISGVLVKIAVYFRSMRHMIVRGWSEDRHHVYFISLKLLCFLWLSDWVLMEGVEALTGPRLTGPRLRGRDSLWILRAQRFLGYLLYI